jgi:glutamate formiminotransferase / 5-formyltetrahydrofolate cyclo-ligase
MEPILEAVPNLSMAEDPDLLAEVCELVVSCGVTVLDASSDADHGRSVITFIGGPNAVERAALTLSAFAVERIDLRQHRGVHPRIGALDVLPFIPLAGMTLDDAVGIAHRVGERIARTLDVPVWFYAAASRPPGRGLAALRAGGFESLVLDIPDDRMPDHFPGQTSGARPQMHPTAGGVIVGARPVLLAWNVDVRGLSMGTLREIARSLRERGGGFSGLRVLALDLVAQGRRQLSMNLEDVYARDPFAVFLAVEQAVADAGGEVMATEIIGIPPDNLFAAAAADRLRLLGRPGLEPLASHLFRYAAGARRPETKPCLAEGVGPARPRGPGDEGDDGDHGKDGAMSQTLSGAKSAVEAAARREDRGALLAALRQLAKLLERAGRQDEAIQIHEQVIQLDPSDPAALAALNRPPPPRMELRTPAMAAVDPQIRARPGTRNGNKNDSATAQPIEVEREAEMGAETRLHIELGQTYIQMELYGEALDRFDAVLESTPLLKPHAIPAALREALLPLMDAGVPTGWPEDEWCRIYYLLGRSEEALGNCASAQEFYRALLARHPTFKDAARRLQLLNP